MGELMVAQRAMGAVIGSLVADAAGQPLHWIYDVKRLDQILKGREGTPEFVDPSQCPYYHQPTGAQSSYGDQTLALLKALVEGKGFDVELYRQQLYKTFGPNTDYDLKAKPKGKDSVPTGGYRHASIKAFLTAYEATKERTGLSPDPQMDGVTKVAPLVALYAGDPKLPQLVEQVVRVTQDDNLAVECSIAAATVLERLVLLPPEDGFLEKMKDQPELSVVSRQLPEVLKLRGTSHREVVQKFGSSCALPGNLLNSLHCLVIPPLTDYSTTVRRTMVAGGCNCSRLCFVGACAGAALGPSGIPADWVKKTTQGEAIKKLSEQLVALRQPEMKGHSNITYDEMTKDHRYPIIPGFPNRCDGLGFDAITLDDQGVTYFFRDEFVWKGYRAPAELINKTWPSLTGQIDAAFRMHHNTSPGLHDRIFFFKGNEVCQYYGTNLEGTFLIHDKFPGIPDNLGAAVECPLGECTHDSVLFFKDDTVYLLDLVTNTVKEKTWTGIQHCTAGLRWIDRYYCFQGTNFTRFNPNTGDVPKGYPKDARDYFMRCEGRGHGSKNYTPADSVLNRCSKRPFDEFNEDELGRTYAFREGWYFRLDTKRDGWHAWPTNTSWSSLYGRIDGVFSWDRKMYFIQGSQLFIYKTEAQYTLIKDYPKPVTAELGIPSTGVDATFVCPDTSLLYVIMGNQLQSVNLEKTPKVLGSGIRISHAHVDGAMCNANGVYVFVGTLFYKYDSPDQLATWLSNPAPHSIAEHFMSCPH